MSADYFEKVADTLSRSASVGPYATRDEILMRLRATFGTEEALHQHILPLVQQLREQFGEEATRGLDEEF